MGSPANRQVWHHYESILWGAREVPPSIFCYVLRLATEKGWGDLWTGSPGHWFLGSPHWKATATAHAQAAWLGLNKLSGNLFLSLPPFLFKSFFKMPWLFPYHRASLLQNSWDVLPPAFLPFLGRWPSAHVIFSSSDFLSFCFCWLAGRQSTTLDV